jgi:hypothetical protein
MVPYFLAVLTVVRSLPESAFVSDDTHGEVIDSHSMVLTAHDFGRHVARGTRGVLRIFRVPDSSDAQVRDTEVALLVKHKVFGFDVPV